MTLIPAIQKDYAFLEDIDAYAADTTHMHIWWLGQSGFLLSWGGYRLLLDPYLSDSLTRKYAETAKPHVRMSERVVDPSLLRHIYLVTSSHNHTDHLDADTLRPLLANNPAMKMVVPEANRGFVAERLGCACDFPLGMDEGTPLTIGPFTIHAIAAAHNDLAVDENGRSIYLGYVIQMGQVAIYHSGDTMCYDGLAEKLQPFQVDLALLPINGHDPARGVAGNLNALEAAALAKAIHARCVIPCHYHMFTFNSVEPDAFVQHCKELAQPFALLQHGERWSLAV